MSLRVSVIGTGDIGSALAELLAPTRWTVVVGSRAGSPAEGELASLVVSGFVDVRSVAASSRDADVVIVAVPWHAMLETVETLSLADGAVVVDATNYNEERDGAELDPGPGGTTSVLRERYPRLRWVKAFNMLWAGFLRDEADPAHPTTVVFVAADDEDAKRSVAALIRDAGFAAFDTGTLDDARARQLQSTPAWNRKLDARQAAILLPGSPGFMTAATGNDS